ncbi:MAG TPA: CGNR zinc finger domain-containing protein [Gemmatimonadales bacterium]|nr:CGNR zinc finger domain-containing protein [Gemmatimonadales bacterium]
MAHPEFTLLGDAVWLDFVNSALGRTPSPPDLLPDAAAFGRWTHAQRLLQLDAGPPFETILDFRRQLTGLAEALSAALQPPAGAITAVNAVLAGCPGIHRLTRIAGEWRLQFAPSRALAPLEAIARSAAATLADRTVLIRRCAGESCSLFFADSSPNRSRRWCCPVTCGANLRVERRRGLLR